MISAVRALLSFLHSEISPAASNKFLDFDFLDLFDFLLLVVFLAILKVLSLMDGGKVKRVPSNSNPVRRFCLSLVLDYRHSQLTPFALS